MSQLVRLEGKHTTQHAHCALYYTQNASQANQDHGKNSTRCTCTFGYLNEFSNVEKH